MDASCLIPSSKNQKLNEEQERDGSSSNIENLPDSILEHILSFLPTKDAVSTSILSKRWQFLWTCIPNLDFKQGSPNKRRLFMNYVERVLLLHDFSNVEKFSLTCDVLGDASRINAWISTAVRRKVQKIHFCLDNFEEPFVLPHCLFTCGSLTELDLGMYNILHLPSPICFSNLKSLNLAFVKFSDDDSTQRLFSGCPALEVLDIFQCRWENLEAVTICAPKLQKLSIDDYDLVESASHGCQVVIFGTSLKYFFYIGELINDYCLYDSSSVVEAYTQILYRGRRDRSREVAYRVSKLLRGLSNVKDLTLSSGALDVLDDAEELFGHLPMLNSLTDLDLSVELVDFNCKALLNILQNSPCLESLEFSQGISVSKSFGKDDCILNPVPLCFLTHLKRIKVRAFNGKEEQMYAIKILLKNATVLDKMVIYCSLALSGDLERRIELLEQLLTLPRGSTSCSIDLY